jgi:hypothetical protein
VRWHPEPNDQRGLIAPLRRSAIIDCPVPRIAPVRLNGAVSVDTPIPGRSCSRRTPGGVPHMRVSFFGPDRFDAANWGGPLFEV